jgi:hypothetical protein
MIRFIFLLFFPLQALAITAQSYIVTDMQGNVLLEKNADEIRSIASITKLFVAEQAVKLDQDEKIKVTHDDVRHGMMKSTPLIAGKYYTRRQLTELALVSSDCLIPNLNCFPNILDLAASLYSSEYTGAAFDLANRNLATVSSDRVCPINAADIR